MQIPSSRKNVRQHKDLNWPLNTIKRAEWRIEEILHMEYPRRRRCAYFSLPIANKYFCFRRFILYFFRHSFRWQSLWLNVNEHISTTVKVQIINQVFFYVSFIWMGAKNVIKAKKNFSLLYIIYTVNIGIWYMKDITCTIAHI